MKGKGHNLSNRIFAILLSVMMVFQMLPVAAIAETPDGWEGVKGAESPVEGATIHEVNFYSGDPSGDGMGNLIATHDIEVGNSIQLLPESPFQEGYTFSGWVSTSGEAVTAATVPTGDMDVKATYTSIGIYTITVNYWYSCYRRKQGHSGETADH